MCSTMYTMQVVKHNVHDACREAQCTTMHVVKHNVHDAWWSCIV